MAASGRYKSRLLNYLVEQSHKLSDQAGQRLRQARTGMVWGAQILIYPLYAAFQTSRLIGRRLSQGGARPGQARLKPPQGDEVVNAVIRLAKALADQGAMTIAAPQPSEVELSPLQSLDPAGLQGRDPSPNDSIATAPQPFPPLTPLKSAGIKAAGIKATEIKPAELPAANLAPRNITTLGGVDIRGVASELSNRALVLIDNSNRTIPLEAEQQWKLQQTIVQQVADYHYRRRRYGHQLALMEASDAGGSLLRDRALPLPQPRPRQLAGIRWMAHLMGWMQTSDLALATNLFQESELSSPAIAPPPFLYWDPEPGQRLTRETLAQLDYPLANLEARYIQRSEKEDAGIKALRFTAKLFGLEEAAEQWLRASRPPSNAAPGNSASSGPTGVPTGAPPMTGPQARQWSDPWGGDSPGEALRANLAPQESQAPKSPHAPSHQSQGWLSSLLNPASPPPADPQAASGAPATPLGGWQRLGHRFSGLLSQLRHPSGPITPFHQSAQPPSSPSVPAPTNETLGHESPSRRQANATQSRLGDPTQTNQNGDPMGTALQERVSDAIAQQSPDGLTSSPGSKSENVTLRSKARGAQAVTASAPGQPLSQTQAANDPNTPQTAETAVTYESPYIETTATFSGYEKHPLEAILERLDRILLWIEELVIKLWQWLHHVGEQ